MNCEFDQINRIIKNYFGDDLTSLIIFGSLRRETRFKIISDLDYIILLKKRVINQDILSRKLKKQLNKYFALLSFNIYDKETFSNLIKSQDWLVLSIKLGYTVIFDEKNFFSKLIEKRFKEIKAKRIAPLGWYIKNIVPDKKLIYHLLNLSKDYLISSRILFKNKVFNIANLLLMNSIHCYLSALLLKRNIFMTRGELAQCFIKNYNIGFKNRFSKELLEMEQICGQIQKISFNFTKGGKMRFIKNKKYLSRFYINKLAMFIRFKKEFNPYEKDDSR